MFSFHNLMLNEMISKTAHKILHIHIYLYMHIVEEETTQNINYGYPWLAKIHIIYLYSLLPFNIFQIF